MTIESYVFPNDLLKDNKDVSKSIIFYAVESLQQEVGAGKITSGSLREGKTKCVIFLPTPENLSDSQNHSWSQTSSLDTVNSMFDSAQKLSGTVFSATLAKLINGTVLKPLSAMTLAASGAIKDALNLDKTSAWGAFALQQGLQKTLINPGYFQNYTTSSPRSFQFSYTFQPRNKEESIAVLNIIRSFKRYSLPESVSYTSEDIAKMGEDAATSLYDGIKDTVTSVGSGDTDFTDISDEFKNTMLGGLNVVQGLVGQITQPHYWKIIVGNAFVNKLLKLDDCVCTSVNITYGNGQRFETFSDGIPKIIGLQLQFNEIKLKFAEEYSSNIKGNMDASIDVDKVRFNESSETISDYTGLSQGKMNSSTTLNGINLASIVHQKVIK